MIAEESPAKLEHEEDEKTYAALAELIRERQGAGKTLAGIDNNGNIVAKNRAYRRKAKTVAQLEGKTKNYYTKKKTKKRRSKNGKVKVIRKRK